MQQRRSKQLAFKFEPPGSLAALLLDEPGAVLNVHGIWISDLDIEPFLGG